MNLTSPEVKDKMSTWETELRELMGDPMVKIRAYYPTYRFESIEKVSEIICEETKVDLSLIKGSCRRRHIVLARQLISYFGRKVTQLTLLQIGTFLGGRDHTTIIHSSATIDDLLEIGDPQVCEMVSRISTRLNHQQGINKSPCD